MTKPSLIDQIKQISLNEVAPLHIIEDDIMDQINCKTKLAPKTCLEWSKRLLEKNEIAPNNKLISAACEWMDTGIKHASDHKKANSPTMIVANAAYLSEHFLTVNHAATILKNGIERYPNCQHLQEKLKTIQPLEHISL